MIVLEIDMGNTRAKWRLREASQILDRGAVPVADFPGTALAEMLRAGRCRPQAIWLAAVCAEELCQSATAFLRQVTGLPVIRVEPVAISREGLRCAYAQPERLGVDRWLAMLAAHGQRTPGLAGTLVVSCGTAITLDFVRADGAHEGGYIVPGLFMMREALLSGTGRIRFEAGEFSLQREPGCDTSSAVQHGIVQAVVSLVECSRREAQLRWNGELEVWLTGGDGARLQRVLPMPCRYEEDLVLDGLCRAC